MSNLTQMTTSSGFGFSAVGIDQLDSSKYTLVTALVDKSGSVQPFKDEMERVLNYIVNSCSHSPNAEALLIRVVYFDRHIREQCGFRLLSTFSDNEFTGTLHACGSTNLFGATLSCVEATYDYGKTLTDQDYDVNGIVYVITDGADNEGACAPARIKSFIADQVTNETEVEDVSVILIEVGENSNNVYFDRFKSEAGLDQFISMANLFKKTSPEKALAKLGKMISQSISSTSMSLQSGNSSSFSNLLTF